MNKAKLSIWFGGKTVGTTPDLIKFLDDVNAAREYIKKLAISDKYYQIEDLTTCKQPSPHMMHSSKR